MQPHATAGRQPYMPDAARAAMPNSPLQPLPPYLLEDFAQSVDRTRPLELIVPVIAGKAANPIRLSNLQYRYTDTMETVTVPNIWYNQTVEMRVEHWRWQADYLFTLAQKAKEQLAYVERFTGATYMGMKTSIAVHRARVEVQKRIERHEDMLQVLDDVIAGKRFV
ncbi:hypothetical protein G3A43_07635 [Paraburkholderia aspalathi]|nr:hypothetical protein [Paraburkholderia aspalathi]MBK3780126.1 hypothetical protein [Paraburkholderia aspalathi]